MESKAEQGFSFPHSSFLQTKEFPLQLEKECGGHMAKRAGLRKNPWHSTVFSLPPPQTPLPPPHILRELQGEMEWGKRFLN